MKVSEFDRRVYGVLGLPIDIEDEASVFGRIDEAVRSRRRLWISTVNTNYLVIARSDPLFRRSIYESDLCTVDGVPLVWILKLLGVGAVKRLAGSDLFDALLAKRDAVQPLKVILFGGENDAAQQAAAKINHLSSNVFCVAAISPGIRSVEALSTPELIDAVNAPGADFLSVSLGSHKGQMWLLKNNDQLSVPVRAHLGAVVNFHAGTVRRAPQLWRRLGAEWLWRIKEEPRLFKRYWNDGWILVYLVLFKVLPLAANLKWHKSRFRNSALRAEFEDAADHVSLVIFGSAVDQNLPMISQQLVRALASGKRVVLDLSNVEAADTRIHRDGTRADQGFGQGGALPRNQSCIASCAPPV